jgi:hypothetical protein
VSRSAAAWTSRPTSSSAAAPRRHPYPDPMDLEFSGEVWFWKGPAPWHFITVPDEQCGQLEAASAVVSYGWGMIPVAARIGDTEWTTSLWPKDGRYIVPVKAWVRKAEEVDVGDTVTVRLGVNA